MTGAEDLLDPGSGRPTDDRIARLHHPRAIRWMHWINFPLLTVMVWSGLRIYWAEDVYAAGIGSWQWFAFFPEWFYGKLDLDRHLARGMAFHFSFAWLFVINGLAYVTYLAWSKEWRHLVPDRRAWREAAQVVLHDLHLRKSTPPQGRYNAAQRISYTVVLVMGAVLVLSGFAIYKPTQLHPQTLLALREHGEPLTQAHGAPLRLATPNKYGIKTIKRIGLIRYTHARPADYWAERSYDWYAGL